MNINLKKCNVLLRDFVHHQTIRQPSVMVVLSFHSSNAAFAKMKIVTEGIQSALH